MAGQALFSSSVYMRAVLWRWIELYARPFVSASAGKWGLGFAGKWGLVELSVGNLAWLWRRAVHKQGPSPKPPLAV
jgi:hypothetical protein